MINKLSSVKIGQVWNAARGTTFQEEIESTPELGDEVKLASPIKANLMLVRMKDGVMAVITDFSTSIELNCSRCLDNFTKEIEVEAFERVFYEHQPEIGFDPMETFLVKQNDMSIDLTESLRQEIILHFPMIPVCSERCKGLCSSCAVNLNHQEHLPTCTAGETATVQDSSTEENKPFANLKNLLNK